MAIFWDILFASPFSTSLSFIVVNYSLEFSSPPTFSLFFSVFLYLSLGSMFIFCNLSFLVKSYHPVASLLHSNSFTVLTLLSAFLTPSPTLFFNFFQLDFPKLNRNCFPTDGLQFFAALSQLEKQ